MIGTLDSQVIEKFKEFQERTGEYLDLDIEKVKFDNKFINDIISEFIKGSTPKYSGQPTNTIVIKSGQARGNYNKFNFTKIAYLDLVKVKNIKYLKKGDILINTTGIGTAGRVTLFDLDDSYVSDSHITTLRYDLNKINKFYLLNFFINFGFKRLESMAEGSGGQIELSMNKVKNISIAIPQDYNEKYNSYEIQKIIVEFLKYWKFNYTDMFRQNIACQKPIMEKIQNAVIPATFIYEETLQKSFNKFSKDNNFNIKLEDIKFKEIDFFTEKIDDLKSPKKLEKNQNLILDRASDSGLPVYSGALKVLCKVKKEDYPKKVFISNNENPDISFANNGDGSAGRNFFIHYDEYFVNQERTVISFNNDNKFYSLYILNQINKMRDTFNMNRENRPTPKDLPKFGIKVQVPFHNKYDSILIQKLLIKFWKIILDSIEDKFKTFNRVENLTDKVDKAFLYRTFSKIDWSK